MSSSWMSSIEWPEIPLRIEPKADFGIGADQVTNQDAAQRTNRNAGGTAHAAAQAHEDRRGRYVTHCHVDNGSIFEKPSIRGFQRQALTAFEDAVGNRNVLKAAVRLGTELDAAGSLNLGGGIEALKAAIEQSAEFIGAGDIAVGNGDVLNRSRVVERLRAFPADVIRPKANPRSSWRRARCDRSRYRCHHGLYPSSDCRL